MKWYNSVTQPCCLETKVSFLHIVRIIGEGVILLGALFNIGLWVRNGFRLPRHVHGIAAIAFMLGGLLSYEVFLLGKSVISTLWFPFLFTGIVYIVFILHGAGSPATEEFKQATLECKTATGKQKDTEGDEESEEWQEPRNKFRG